MKKLLLLLALIPLAGAGWWFLSNGNSGSETPYRLAAIERGDIEATVSSTGTLSAVGTVEVGTQVSGTIAHLYTDYNQRVRRGQLIALIDTTMLAAAIRDASANLERNSVLLEQAEYEHDRMRSLFEQQFVSEREMKQAEHDLKMARASLKSAQANLDRAEINLRYASIHAPIDGTVIERNVDVGQTVAASLSAPILFLIADDLSKMQILAQVDEGDIGQIKEGQTVRFTVSAHRGRTFNGIVEQVRLQPETVQNVVNYTVVINVDNPDGLLLPGMTATVDFLIERATDVFKVPNAALRVRPTPEMMTLVAKGLGQQGQRSGEDADVRRNRAAQMRGIAAQGGLPANEGSPGTRATVVQQFGESGLESGLARLWLIDGEGKLRVVTVETGITDGRMTEVRSEAITEDLQIITGIAASAADAGGSGNPFQQSQQQGPRRIMGGPF